MTSVLFAAACTARYQSPPFERPSGHAALLLRVPTSEEGQRDTWRLPYAGELDHPGELAPWIDGASLARLDSVFTPTDVPTRDVQWVEVGFAASCLPRNFEPGVLPALQRFVRDQTLDSILARADAATHSQGDDDMSAEVESLKRQLAALERRVGPPASDPQEFRQAQVRADSVMRAIGDAAGAPSFMNGERLIDYRARLLKPLQKHSAKFRNVDLSKVGDPVALSVVEDSIFADAVAALRDPATFQPGEMRAVVTVDPSGRPITRYVGHPSACWDQFNPGIRHITRFNTTSVAR